MRKVSFGKTGVEVSHMCLGTMMFGEQRCDERETDAILGAALDHGVTFVDTAAMYVKGRTEEILGAVLGARRQKIFLTTKAVQGGVDGPTIRASIDQSLTRLKTDHVDLYMIHWPQAGMHPVEMMAALNDVVKAGKTRFVGFCNCPAWFFAHCNSIAIEHGWPQLVANQVPYNPIERGIEVEILPQAAAENIGLTAYRPLVIGLLAGKYSGGQSAPTDTRGVTDERITRWLVKFGSAIDAFKQKARDKGVPPAHLAIAWVASHATITAPIVGVSSRKQLESGIGAFDVTLTADERAEISALFGAEVKEESAGKFAELRRDQGLVAPA